MIRNRTDFLRKTVGFLALAVLTLSHVRAAEGDPYAEILQPVFQQSCVKCHGDGDEAEGELNLRAFKNANDLTRDLDLLRELIDVLELEEMPPQDEPPLKPEQRKLLVTQLRNLLHVAVRTQTTIPKTPIRRMNRFQYSNAVEDLFELKVELFALPERMLREEHQLLQLWPR